MDGTIRRLRIAAGKSPAQVAADLGISERTVYRLEAQPVLPRRWCLAFATYFGVTPEEIEGCAEAVS